MPATVVIGAQWGDEGKAKVIDWLVSQLPNLKGIVRYQGGCNAGHTVVQGGKTYKFHLIPSGILNPKMLCVIGPGTVILPEVLVKELETLKQEGLSSDNLKISERAHLSLPYHQLLDSLKETELADAKIGTTGKGIGPTYEDKVTRMGLRLGDLLLPEDVLKKRLECILMQKNPLLEKRYGQAPVSIKALVDYCNQYKVLLAPYIANTDELLWDTLDNNQQLLLEGAQGTMLDLDFGTYPFVTSSNPVASGAYVGAGLPPKSIDKIIGVTKAYTTRVGEGPFPTELLDEQGEALRQQGREFGTTTGRPRRCGWLDLVALRYAAKVNGLDALVVTKLDVLSGLDAVKVCNAYRNTQTGELIRNFPTRLDAFEAIEPVYETFMGWSSNFEQVSTIEDLPQTLRHFLDFIEAETQVPVLMASIGADREASVVTMPDFFCASQKQLLTCG